MHEIGLYHPRIHFPSDAWIKAAALYWTKMARIVPPGYVPRDSDAVHALRDELDFVVDVELYQSQRKVGLGEACSKFVEFVDRNHSELRVRYGISRQAFDRYIRDSDNFPFGFEPWDNEQGDPLVAEVADNKLGTPVREPLVSHGLGFASGRNIFPGISISSTVVHPRLARVYMSALAEDVARANHLRPTTSDPDVFAVGNGWTVNRMRSLLLSQDESNVPIWKNPSRDLKLATPDVIGMIAVRTVIPSGIDQVPVKKIIKIREQFASQFTAFRDAVDTIANEVDATLEAIQDPAVVHAYLTQEVNERLLAPVKELRREMRQMKIDTATATLTFKYEVPAIASLVAGGMLVHEPLLAGGAAVAVGLLVQGTRAKSIRRSERDSSPASYLMLLHDHLGAHSTIQRAAHQIRRIIGLA